MASAELEILITASNQAKQAIDEIITGLSGVRNELGEIEKATDAREAARRLEQLARSADEITGSMGEASGEVKKFSQENEKSTQTSRQATRATKQQGQASREAAQDMGVLAQGASTLTKRLVSLAAAYLSLRAALRFVAQGLREAAATQRLDTALRTLGEGAGITERQIQGTVRAVEQFGVSGQAARQSLLRLTQANVDLATSTKLAEAAQNLALSTGQETDQVFQQLAFAVQTGNTVLLRRAGIVVDQTAAEQKLADSLGIATSALDENQKRQAVANAIIAEGARLQGIAGEAAATFAARMSELPIVTGDLAETIGKGLLPGINELLGAFITLVRNLRQSAQQFFENSGFAQTFEQTMRNLGQTLLSLERPLGQILKLILLLVGAIASFNDNLAGILVTIGFLIRFLPVWGQVLTVILGVISLLEAAGIDLAEIFRVVGRAVSTLTGVIRLRFLDIVDSIRLFALAAEEAWNLFLRAIGQKTGEEVEKARKAIDAQRQEILKARRERINDFFRGLGPGQASAEVEQLSKEREKIKALNIEIRKSEQEVQDARERGDASALAGAVFKLNAQKEERKQIEETINTLEDQRKAETSLGKEREQRAQAGGVSKQEQDRLKAVNKAFLDLLQGQGVASQGFNNLSATGSKAVGDLEKILLDLNKRFQEGADVDLPKVRLAILGAFGQLKTVDDFTNAIDQLNQAIELGAQGLDRLSLEARFRRGQVALQEINQQLGFFSDALTQIRSLQEDYNSLVLQGVQSELAVQQVQAEITNNTRLQHALELRQIAVTVSANRRRYADEQELIERTAREQRLVASENIADERSRNAALIAIDNNKTQALLKNTKTYYDALRTAQNEFLQQFRSAANEIKNIDQNAAQSRRSTANQIRDIQRSTLSEEGKQFDRRRELVEQQDQFQFALAARDEQRANEALARQRQLAQEIRGGAGDPEANAFAAIRVLEDVEQQQQQLFTQQRAAAVEVANQAKAGFTALENELASITTQFQQLASTQIASLQVQVDQTSLSKAVAQVQSAFENIVVTIATVATPAAAAPGLAGGGRVPGSSPHARADNILARLTAGEWVTPVKAVRFWGENFMSAINNMRMPKFADGGIVQRFAEGGSVGQTSNSGLTTAVNKLTTATSGLIAANSTFQSHRTTPIVLDLGILGTHEVQGNDKQIENLKLAITRAASKRRRS